MKKKPLMGKTNGARRRGGLALAEIARGIEICLANATRHFDDGLILLKHGSKAGGLHSILLAEQEAGKVSTIHAMARIHVKDQKAWKPLGHFQCDLAGGESDQARPEACAPTPQDWRGMRRANREAAN